MSLQQERDLRWMLKFQGYKSEDNKKFVKTVGKHIARSIEFLEGDNIIMKYVNTESGFKEKRELKLEDAFNWIS